MGTFAWCGDSEGKCGIGEAESGREAACLFQEKIECRGGNVWDIPGDEEEEWAADEGRNQTGASRDLNGPLFF